MDSPVLGFLVFAVMGLVQAWHSRHTTPNGRALDWTHQDSWLALSFMSIPLFKALSALWSATPELAWKNALQHSYFLFWPFVLVALHHCQSSQRLVDRALTLGLLAYTAFAISIELPNSPIAVWAGPRQNQGIAAQIAMLIGTWNLLALTRPDHSPKPWRTLQGCAFVATFVALILTTRRLELLGFTALSALVITYRFRRHLTGLRAVFALLFFAALLGLLVYLRWEKFALGFEQIAQYRLHGAHTPDFTVNSWGIRLELWRVGWAAFMDHPWLGIGAAARPFSMQEWGAPPAELFSHKHFHSHLIQTLVEGGLLGLLVWLVCMIYSTRQMIVKPFKTHPETALLAAAVLGTYGIEGLASAALHYDKANALLVVSSAWVWVHLRSGYRKFQEK